MTLAEWLSKYPKAQANYGTSTGIVNIYYDTWINQDIGYELYHLSDYVVTSVTGGCIWLTPRDNS